MSDATVEFWFEFGSTYSYPAAMRVEEAAAKAGVGVAWRPFLLGPIFKSQGWNDSPFNIYPAKGRYMWRDMERICEAAGLALTRPSRFPRNGLLAARIAFAGQNRPWIGDWVRAVYAANFAHDLEISDPAVLAELLASLDLDAALLEEAASEEVKGGLRTQTEHAITLGIFGAPTLAVNGEIFWGGDRIEAALAWATSRAEP